MKVDQTLVCCDCSESFVFTASEQQYFARIELRNLPKRCPNCRIAARVSRAGGDPERLVEVPCADCGKETRISFVPHGKKPIYCTPCFYRRKEQDANGSKQVLYK